MFSWWVVLCCSSILLISLNSASFFPTLSYVSGKLYFCCTTFSTFESSLISWVLIHYKKNPVVLYWMYSLHCLNGVQMHLLSCQESTEMEQCLPLYHHPWSPIAVLKLCEHKDFFTGDLVDTRFGWSCACPKINAILLLQFINENIPTTLSSLIAMNSAFVINEMECVLKAYEFLLLLIAGRCPCCKIGIYHVYLSKSVC